MITEDSNSGFQFFKNICEKKGIKCIAANDKSNIFKYLYQEQFSKILVIADGAAFGPEMGRVMPLLRQYDNIALYLPESFEWLILSSNIISDNKVEMILEEPYEYIESSRYFSWERYFSDLLIEKTNNTYLKYAKHSLNPVYVQKNIADKILEIMNKIKFE